MGNLASGHFKPTNNIQEQHNDRTLSPSYLIPQEFRGQNEVNRHSKQAMILKNQIIENAHEAYLITFKQKSQAKSYQWSLVVNIKTNTTMSDLEKLAEHFEIKYGFQCYQIAIHRDEGYMDENNQPHINHHAHMEFITLNKENGKNTWGQINQVKLRQIQTEIAQILGMERGTDKRVSGAERIEPRKYAQMKEKERKERLKDAEFIDRLIRSISEFGTNNKILNQKIKAKNQKIDELQERPTTEQYKEVQQERNALKKEIDTALNTANEHFQSKAETLQEAVARIKKNSEMLSAIYNFLEHIAPNYVSGITEKYKHVELFAKTFGVVKKLKELYSKIMEKLFGDEKTEKDPQDILNTISELQERPTKQQLEAKESIIQAKEKELNTLKQEKNTLENKLQEQATETKKAQERIKTLESNETALIEALYDKENIIQSKGRTINRLKKELKELEDNYRLERERMVAENKHLKDQGLEKIHTQKDYEQLKEQHEKEVEALKKEIQELEKTIKKNNEYTYTKRM